MTFTELAVTLCLIVIIAPPATFALFAVITWRVYSPKGLSDCPPFEEARWNQGRLEYRIPPHKFAGTVFGGGWVEPMVPEDMARARKLAGPPPEATTKVTP